MIYLPEAIFQLSTNPTHALTAACLHGLMGAPFINIGYFLIPARISNHTPIIVWDTINYPFPNFNCRM